MSYTMSNIFQMSHSSNNNLTSISSIPINSQTDTDRELINTINKFGLDINNFYKIEKQLYPYCYTKDTVLVELYASTEEYFINFHVIDMINTRHKIHNQCIVDKDYQRLLFLIDKPFRFKFYEKFFNDISDNEKYEIFIDIYNSSEYGFDQLSREFIEKVFEYKPISQDDKGDNLSQLDDIITIYRGEGSLSTPYTKTYSWTTDIDVARWFANRFDENGKIYKGHVKKENVLEYVEDRGESEILVYPENVFDVEMIE